MTRRIAAWAAAGEKSRAEAEYRTDRVPTANSARVQFRVEHVHLWSTETPVLYRAVIELTARGGQGHGRGSLRYRL